MKKKISLFFVLLIVLIAISLPVHRRWVKNPKHRYIRIENPRYNPGMFAVFSTVIGFLDWYEKNQNPGLVIDFQQQGLYYEPTHGPNWWQYYLEPVHLGNPIKEQRLLKYSNSQYGELAMHVENSMSREEVHRLIQKYFKIRQSITDQVESFTQQHFQGDFVIGVHFRGTDKQIEALPVPYAKMKEAIELQIKQRPLETYRIFVATDEHDFLKFIKEAFPGKVISIEMDRSIDGSPIHMNARDPFLQGEQALIDALLLSKTQVLIRTQSNLSLWSSYFNPTLPVITLNQRHVISH